MTLGEHHLKNEDWFEQSRRVKAIYLHPKYEESKNIVTENQIKEIPPDYDVGKTINNDVISFKYHLLTISCSHSLYLTNNREIYDFKETFLKK